MTLNIRTRAKAEAARPKRTHFIQRRPDEDNTVTIALAILLAISVVFLKWPEIDLAVSKWFYTQGSGFTLKDDPVLRALRKSGRVMTFIVASLCLALLLASRFYPRARQIMRPSNCLFLLGSLAIGPGLLVNGVLKNFWGRARPRNTMDFGGEFPFSPAWLDPNHCDRNCSFVSGEAAVAFWLVGIAFIVPRRFRVAVLALILPYSAAVSLNRIVFGGHYVSDVLIAWAIMLILLIVLARTILAPSRAVALDGFLIRSGNVVRSARSREA